MATTLTQSLVSSNNAPQSTREPHRSPQHGETESHSTNREKLTATTRVLPTRSACANITTRPLLWRHYCDVVCSLQVGQTVPPESLSFSSITSNCIQGNERKLSSFFITFCFNEEFYCLPCHLCVALETKCEWLHMKTAEMSGSGAGGGRFPCVFIAKWCNVTAQFGCLSVRFL